MKRLLVTTFFTLILLEYLDGRVIPQMTASGQNAEVPRKCAWSKTDCERLRSHEEFKVNCDTKSSDSGDMVYSCQETCSQSYSFYCKNHYCLGYQEHCLPTTTSTQVPTVDPDAKPTMCYWADEQCEDRTTDPEFYVNCDQMNPMHDNRVYSCYEKCKRQSSWCDNHYCTNYTRECSHVIKTAATSPLHSTLSQPISLPPTTEKRIFYEPTHCQWSEKDCQIHQKHEDFEKNCEMMPDSPESKPYSCLEKCKQAGHLCSPDQCSGYKLSCLKEEDIHSEEKISERLNKANLSFEDVMLTILVIGLFGLIMWKVIKHCRCPRKPSQVVAPQEAKSKGFCTRIIERFPGIRRLVPRSSVGAFYSEAGVNIPIPTDDNHGEVTDDEIDDPSQSLLQPKLQRQFSGSSNDYSDQEGGVETRLGRMEQTIGQMEKHLQSLLAQLPNMRSLARRTSSAKDFKAPGRITEVLDNDGKKGKSRYVGGYKIYEVDWTTLENGRLSDEMVTALVHKMVNEHKPNGCEVHIASFHEKTLGEWSSKDVVFWLRKTNNNDNTHFYLVILEVEAKKMHICDSIEGGVGAEQEKQELISCEQGLKDFHVSTNQLKTDKQPDGESCGLYVVMFVEKYLTAVKDGKYKVGEGQLHLEFKTSGGSSEPFTYRHQLINLIESAND